MKVTKNDPTYLEDLGFAVVTGLDDGSWAYFDIYRVEAHEVADHGELVPLYGEQGEDGADIDSAAPFLSGIVRSDGCSDWRGEVDFHGCERDHLENVGKVLTWCWDWNKANNPKFYQ